MKEDSELLIFDSISEHEIESQEDEGEDNNLNQKFRNISL